MKATSGRQAGGDQLQCAAHDPLPEDGQADLSLSGSGATASASADRCSVWIFIQAFGEVDAVLPRMRASSLPRSC